MRFKTKGFVLLLQGNIFGPEKFLNGQKKFQMRKSKSWEPRTQLLRHLTFFSCDKILSFSDAKKTKPVYLQVC